MSQDPHSAESAEAPVFPPLSRLSVGLLMALGTLGQLSINIVLPSLPAISEDLQAAPGGERLVISVFLIGFAGGQLLVGPLSDRFGRRKILIPGLVLYAVFGGISAISATLDWLLVARLLQGLGAASGFVLARAITRDAFQGEAMIKTFGLLTLAMGIVPAIAPPIGGLFQEAVGWEANMYATVVVGIIMTVLCFISLPETGTRSLEPLSPPKVAATYISIIKDRTFRRFAGTNAMTLGSLYAFHAGGPELIIRQLGNSPSSFGIIAIIYSVAFMLGAYLAPKIRSRGYEASHIMIAGATCMLLSAIAMLIFGLTGQSDFFSIMVLMTPFGFGLGIAIPLGVSGSLAPFKARAATATALLGAVQMGAGAISSAIVAAFPESPAIAFPVVMIVMNIMAILNARRSRHEKTYEE